VNVTDAPVKPAAASPFRYSRRDRAPAMQPAYDPAAARSAWVMWSSATTSEIPIRPPGEDEDQDAENEDTARGKHETGHRDRDWAFLSA
jgi:hypothetical protein